MKTIIRNILPCWYELSWDPKKVAIILRVHRDFIRSQKVIPENAPIIRHFKEEFGFQHFGHDLANDFGFDQALKIKSSFGEFVEFEIKVPKVKVKTDKLCGVCNGSGKDKFRPGKCLFCQGRGKEYFYNWKKAYAISASLNAFFILARIYQGETSTNVPQLMEIQLATHRGMHGGSLSGDYGVKVCDFLRSLGPRYQIDNITEVMIIAHQRMFGKINDYEKRCFRATLEDDKGWLNIICPGNACCLHPSTYHREAGFGYEFSCHNVDSPMQQLTLLAALAALHDLVRKNIK